MTRKNKIKLRFNNLLHQLGSDYNNTYIKRFRHCNCLTTRDNGYFPLHIKMKGIDISFLLQDLKHCTTENFRDNKYIVLT